MKKYCNVLVIILISLLYSGCAWYKGPKPMADANANLDGSSLNELGPNADSFQQLQDMDVDYGGEYADNGGNYDTTNFDNVD